MNFGDKKKELALVGLGITLAAVLVGQLIAAFQSGTNPPGAGGLASNGENAIVMQPTLTKRELTEMLKTINAKPKPYNQLNVGRDAMNPVGVIVDTPPTPCQAPDNDLYSLEVSAIIYDLQRPLAVINEQVVGVGEEYDAGIKVDKIKRDQVILQIGDRFYPKKLKEL